MGNSEQLGFDFMRGTTACLAGEECFLEFFRNAHRQDEISDVVQQRSGESVLRLTSLRHETFGYSCRKNRVLLLGIERESETRRASFKCGEYMSRERKVLDHVHAQVRNGLIDARD